SSPAATQGHARIPHQRHSSVITELLPKRPRWRAPRSSTTFPRDQVFDELDELVVALERVADHPVFAVHDECRGRIDVHGEDLRVGGAYLAVYAEGVGHGEELLRVDAVDTRVEACGVVDRGQRILEAVAAGVGDGELAGFPHRIVHRLVSTLGDAESLRGE